LIAENFAIHAVKLSPAAFLRVQLTSVIRGSYEIAPPASSRFLLTVPKSFQIKFYRSPEGKTYELRETHLRLEDGHVFLISAKGEREPAKNGEYMSQDGRLITVSRGEITHAKAAAGN
jgi:hypothetical protein